MSLEIANKKLKQQLRSLLETAKENEHKFKRFESFEYKLLAADSFEDLLNILVIDYLSWFNVDFTSIILSDSEITYDKFFKPFLSNKNFSRIQLLHLPSDIEKLERLSKKTYFSNYKPSKHGWLQVKNSNKEVKSLGILPLVRHGKTLGLFCCFSNRDDRFDSNSGTDFMIRLGNIISICLENVLNHEQLTLITYTDPLTRTRNRRYFEIMLEQEVNRTNRGQTAISCVLLDIDHFKAVNDTYGHQAGDDILVNVVKRINSVLRTHEILARYGGEEFILILSGTTNESALHAAERIIEVINKDNFTVNDNLSIEVTISAGVATFTSRDIPPPASIIQEQLVLNADKALYISKENGRNQVQTSGEIEL